ncbi:MAG: methylated-DNA--[Oscillospiraceae bacterium]|nr:methylated-DNA--[protein]-cysteine S-methyltransferase [Oscillospiraceae bacterium]
KCPSAEGFALAPHGSAFQQKVWRELQKIPYGKTVTYGELAARLGSSPRAVGGAVGRNPISVMVPCHRVVGAKGALTGYAGGTDKKTWLLEHEKTR